MTSHKRSRGSKPSWSSAIKCSGWASGRASIPPGMDSSAMLRHWRCLPAGHCTVAQLTCCEPCMYRHHVCSRWQRGIEICARQSSWSAAPAERVDVASEVVRRQLWSWLSIEARPVLAWPWAELNALPCLAQGSCALDAPILYRLRRLCLGKPLIALGGVSREKHPRSLFTIRSRRAFFINMTAGHATGLTAHSGPTCR